MRDKPLILIVDDDPNFREIFSMKLGAAGFETATAQSPDGALFHAKKLHPDLILMDIHMPGGTGTDAAVSLKQDPETKDIKVAFLSNLKDPWPATKGDKSTLTQAIGIDGYIEKTENLDQIVEKVKEILGRS